jgi:hypothetical protein
MAVLGGLPTFKKAGDFAGATGMDAVIFGPPGIGKTTLLATAQESELGKDRPVVRHRRLRGDSGGPRPISLSGRTGKFCPSRRGRISARSLTSSSRRSRRTRRTSRTGPGDSIRSRPSSTT